MTIHGLHHITLGCSDAQRTIDFYTGVLGLRMIKLTVNFDDPGTYHLYFGDETGSPGTAITFFEWPKAKRGHPGIGGTDHFALRVANYEGLLKWKRRLTDLGLVVSGPADRINFQTISFSDPDGTRLEIATDKPLAQQDGFEDPGEVGETTWSEPVDIITQDMTLTLGMHHISIVSSDLARSNAFYGELLGMERIEGISHSQDGNDAHWTWGVNGGEPGTLVTAMLRDPSQGPRARIGTGQTHHFALGVPDEEKQCMWWDKLVQAGLRVSTVMDRVYFKSIYTRDPDGHILELATMGPGFLVDETVDGLGQALRLPSWLEDHRSEIESKLRPVNLPMWEKA
jgi:glyoxalase family protein